MTTPELQPFVRLLEERIGLDAMSIGHDEVGRAVRRRVDARSGRGHDPRLPSTQAYLALLLSDAEEWDEFVEHVLVGETWFFREPSAFDLLQAVAGDRIAAGRRCRLLSVPCATGEEPYSMAMGLLEAGLAGPRVSIEALDLSGRALEAARRAIYAPRAVRYVGHERLATRFTREGDAYRLSPEVTSLVEFNRGNLVDEHLFDARGRYDVIFCRNVLIYLTRAARDRVLATLAAALEDDGWLVTGHAETSGVVAPRFVPAGVPRTFAYRKAVAGALRPAAEIRPAGAPVRRARQMPASLSRPALGRGAPRGAISDPPGSPRAVRTPGEQGPASLAAATIVTPAPTLSEVERLADAGDLAQAAESCRAYLAANPGASQAYYLLGVIESARGDGDAAEVALRRAIYLDPGHVAALRALGSERQRLGDEREAAQLLRRADVVRSRSR